MISDIPATIIFFIKEEFSPISLLTSKPKQQKVTIVRLKALNNKGFLMSGKVLNNFMMNILIYSLFKFLSAT
jgi:hypothetical protein